MRDPKALLEKAQEPARKALRWHPFYRGKIQVVPKCSVRGLEDLAVWYTPGVAAPCRTIEADPERVWDQTNRANTIAVVSNGTRVLGLGNIGPAAGLPVMEGKALLFKFLGGVDAVPLCVDAPDPDTLVRVTQALEPSFGGINLEDVAQPGCFRVLDRLRNTLAIPVWHDDQQGTATVTLAGLRNALRLLGRDLSQVRIALIGFGAANVANLRLLLAAGVEPGAVVACDRGGVLHPGREDVEARQREFPEKWSACTTTNADAVRGGIAEALRGADVCLAFSQGGVIEPGWVEAMSSDPVVFACANPIPEIWPWEAAAAGARIVATGRGDFPNQVNNSLGFPGIFRGALDVRASAISDEMALAAADALATYAAERDLREDAILPTMVDWEVFVEEAVATAAAAMRGGLARNERSDDEVRGSAQRAIVGARDALRVLEQAGVIPAPPEDD